MKDTDKDYTWYTSPAGDRVERTWANFVAGRIPIEELDDTECSQMRMRADDGAFRGPKPYIDRTMFIRFKREISHRYEIKIAQALLPQVTETMLGILESEGATAGEKFRAAQYLTERVLGKVPDKVEVTAEVRPWEGTVAGILQDVEDDDRPKEIERDEGT